MSSLQSITEKFNYGSQEVTLETGKIARQADAAVKVSMGDTVVLVTVVGLKEAKAGQSFFPLTVNYQEKIYAAGRIPGGYFKREGRPTERETLTSRLIDRPLRPLFPKSFRNEVQVIATVLSVDPQVDPDMPAMLGASAALTLSGMPFAGPIAGARVGYQAGEYLLNPTTEQRESSQLDLVVAGTADAVIMVESEAQELSEDIMLQAVMFGHQHMQVAIEAINRLKEAAGKPAWILEPASEDEALISQVNEFAESRVIEAYQVSDKMVRKAQLDVIRQELVETLCADQEDDALQKYVSDLFAKLEKRIVRTAILEGKPRIDGRDTRTVRPISVETGVLPRVHGSALFTRGETQALVVATLAGARSAQMLEDIMQGDIKDSFMLHYNFPPYSVGEVGFMSSPKRREIGHGRLARRSIEAVLPSDDEFPYVMRVVSEITESNGSSSMASVCGASLALMDAGVPMKAPVAGIAMGLIKDADNYAVITDILGDEDHLGDMDFKVAGTADGVTALQMDIKITGITETIMQQALAQANEARMHILGIMNEALSTPRTELSSHAPRILTMKINPDKIRDVIGKGGAVIKGLSEETGAAIDITDDGVITIAGPNQEAGEEAMRRIEQITAEPEVGIIYEGKVVKIMDFGAFVNIMPGKDGLVHISEISQERVNDVNDVLSEGQKLQVKVLEVDRQGRIRLTIKGIE